MDGSEKVTLGALLHDIGKFIQRGEGKPTESHDQIGFNWLRKTLQGTEFEGLEIFCKYHHKKELRRYGGDKETLEMLRIVCEADSISSKEREKGEVKYKTPLKSIFSSVYDSYPLYYMPKELSLSDINYPTELREVDPEKYSKLFEKFSNEFKGNLETLNADKLLILLEKYTSFIPSKMSPENDVSLFDHLKTSAAIASCLYLYHKNNGYEGIGDRRLKKFLFVVGDISGIQGFIYNITSKGALKYLRARSSFVEMLCYDVALEIVKELKLTTANIIFIGGGNFTLFLPNIEESKKVLEDVKRRVNDWLLRETQGDLYFSIACVEADGSLMEMKSGGRDILEEVQERLERDKKRRYYTSLSGEWWVLSGTEEKETCKVCGFRTESLKKVEQKGIEVCKFCYNLWNLGDKLLKENLFIRIDNQEVERAFKLPFSSVVPIGKEEVYRYPPDSFVFLKNSFDVIDTPHRQISYLFADYAVRKEDDKSSIKSFSDFNTVGVDKAGLLKMDVDRLGEILSKGFKSPSPSRYAAFSRLLNLFFKGHLNTILFREISGIPQVAGGEDIVVIYSGGDDLFIGGSWNDVFNAAFRIWRSFKEYVGNPHITISAGYGVFDKKAPLMHMAEEVSERLEIAKEEGRNRIFVMRRRVGRFDKHHSYVWEDFVNIWNKYIEGIYNAEKSELTEIKGFSTLRILQESRELYLKDDASVFWFIYPLYHLSRRKEASHFQNLFRIDPEKKEEPQEIFYIDVPLRIVEFATRR